MKAKQEADSLKSEKREAFNIIQQQKHQEQLKNSQMK
jgi:hypothetical protein